MENVQNSPETHEMQSHITALESQLSSQNSYEKFFNTIQDFLFITDKDGVVLLFNDAVRNILKYEDSDLIGKNLLILHPEDLRLQAVENLHAILAGKLDYCPLDIVAKDGTRHRVQSTVTLGKINDQTVMFGVSRDVTHRRNIEQMLIDSESRFRKAFDINSAAMALSTLETGEFISVNRNFEILTGYSAAEVIGKTSASLSLFPDDNVRNQIKDLTVKSENVLNREIACRRKNGEIRATLFSVCLFDREQSIVLTTATDIEPMYQNRAALEDLVEQKTQELKITNDRLNSVIKGSQAGIWDWSVQSGALVINERWAEILGYTLEELSPVSIDTWFSVCHPQDAIISDAKLQKHFSHEADYYECEVRLKHKDGRWIWVLDRGQVLEWDDQGKPVRVSGTHIDYTLRKEAEIQLSNRNMIEEIVTGISISFVKSNNENLDDLINSALKKIGEFATIDRSYVFLFKDDGLTMDNTHEWCAPGIEPQLENLQELPSDIFPWWMSILRRFEPIYIPILDELPPEAESEKQILQEQDILSVLVLPIYVQKRLIGFIGLDSVRMHKFWLEEDIRLLEQISYVIANSVINREAQQVIIDAKNRAEESDRIKSQFIANINHEIRTPFTVISGFLDMLPANEIDEEFRVYLSYAKSSAKQLNRIIEQMFEIKKWDSEDTKVRHSVTNIKEIIDNRTEYFKQELGSKPLSLSVEYSGRSNWQIISDYNLLYQLITELLSNACKFTEQGNVRVRVQINMNHPRPLHISIADTGIGIPQNQLETIYTPFSQVDGSFTRKHDGIGLGLTIAYKNITKLGGKISIKSVLNVGTEVNVEIPVELPINIIPAKDSRPLEMQNQKKILIVEDSLPLQNIMRTLLSEDGYSVITASNGQEAVDQYANEYIDLILMDIQMPVMNGLQATLMIREMEENTSKRTPIIGVTAHATAHDRNLCIEAGMNDVLFKPVKTSDLLGKILFYIV